MNWKKTKYTNPTWDNIKVGDKLSKIWKYSTYKLEKEDFHIIVDINKNESTFKTDVYENDNFEEINYHYIGWVMKELDDTWKFIR